RRRDRDRGHGGREHSGKRRREPPARARRAPRTAHRRRGCARGALRSRDAVRGAARRAALRPRARVLHGGRRHSRRHLLGTAGARAEPPAHRHGERHGAADLADRAVPRPARRRLCGHAPRGLGCGALGDARVRRRHRRLRLRRGRHRKSPEPRRYNRLMSDVYICEVGPRDGLQNAKHRMSTEAKQAWIAALARAGMKEIEVGSFVPPKLIPAMADTGDIVRFARGLPGVKVVALAPNLKGFQRAVEAGAHKVTFPVSASHAHSLSNVRMTPDQMVDEVRKCAELAPSGVEIEGAVATAFGCTLQGEVPEDEVVRIAERLAGFCDAVAIADTVGYANPAQIRRVFRRVKAAIGPKPEAAHLHNTRGLGLANALAAYEEGV